MCLQPLGRQNKTEMLQIEKSHEEYSESQSFDKLSNSPIGPGYTVSLRESPNLALDCGLGERNSLGFRFVDLKEAN